VGYDFNPKSKMVLTIYRIHLSNMNRVPKSISFYQLDFERGVHCLGLLFHKENYEVANQIEKDLKSTGNK
jgi:hypothetical protein